MNCNKDHAVSTLEQMENYARQLESRLNDYNEIVAERDEMQNKMKTSLTLLDSMENKQMCIFNEIIDRHNELCNEYEFQIQQSKTLNRENECLRIEREQLNNELHEQEVLIQNVSTACSTLEENARELQDQLLRINETIDNLRAIQKQTELKLSDTDQKIILARNTVAENLAQRKKLQNIIHAELRENMNLQSVKSRTKIENEKIIRSLQTEKSTVKNQLNEKLIELVDIKNCFISKEQECDVQNEQLKELKKKMCDLQNVYENEKCSANEEMCSLQAEAESLGTKLALINTDVLCNAQKENDKLKCNLEYQNCTVNKLMLAEEQMRREIEQNKKAVELAQQRLVIERKQRFSEKKFYEKKLSMKAQEKCELQKLFEDQGRRIKRLQMEMAAIKPTVIAHNSQTTLT